MIYFDYAAATPLDERVRQAMEQAQLLYANPSASYAAGREANAKLDQARADIARVLGCRTAEIIFTSSGTEADNLAIFGLVEASGIKRASIITIGTEHKAVVEPIQRLADRGHSVHFAKVDGTGLIQLDDVRQLIDDTTVLIAVALASSEIGTIQPAADIVKIMTEVRADRQKRQISTPLQWHADGSATELLSLNTARLGIDTLSLNAAKLYGPKGSGALYIRRGTKLAAQILGGEQEFGLRAGTENLAGAIGLATALQKADKIRVAEIKRRQKLVDELWSGIQEIYPSVELNGHPSKRLVGTLNFCLPGMNGETLVDWLDARGVAVATGAACTASDHKPSVALLALGLTPNLAQSSLRLTLGRSTTAVQIQRFLSIFQTVIAKLDTIKT